MKQFHIIIKTEHGNYPNIGIQNFESGLALLDPLTITVCYDHQ